MGSIRDKLIKEINNIINRKHNEIDKKQKEQEKLVKKCRDYFKDLVQRAYLIVDDGEFLYSKDNYSEDKSQITIIVRGKWEDISNRYDSSGTKWNRVDIYHTTLGNIEFWSLDDVKKFYDKREEILKRLREKLNYY